MSVSSLSLMGISGYDFTSIIDAMVSNYSLPLDRMQTKQTALETKKDAWRDVNTRLSALDNTLDSLRKTTTWSATSASSGNTDILSVSSSAGATKGSYNVKVTQVAVAQTAVSSTQVVDDSSSATSVSAGSFRITVGEKTSDITVAAGASLDTIAEAINNAGVGVTASVIQVTGGYTLAIMSEETGTENAASFSDISGNSLASLGVLDAEGVLNTSQEAKDAKLVINGISEITSSSNTVSSAIPGLTLNLNSEDPDTTVIVKISANSSTAQSAVQSFVDQYNSVVSFIEGKLQYIKESETKGDLYGDSALEGIQNRLRSMVGSGMNNTSSTFNILADVGISTSSDDFGKSATLEFDTTKFAEALKEDADSVANLFGASAGGVTPVTQTSGSEKAQGLANMMKEYLNPLVMYQGILAKTQDSYQNQITDLKESIVDFQARIDDYTERINTRFTTLETQLAALDSQRDYLQSQFDSLTSSDSDS